MLPPPVSPRNEMICVVPPSSCRVAELNAVRGLMRQRSRSEDVAGLQSLGPSDSIGGAHPLKKAEPTIVTENGLKLTAGVQRNHLEKQNDEPEPGETMVLFTLHLVAQPFEEVAAIHVTPRDLCTCPQVLWSTPCEPTAAAVSGLKGVFSTLHISYFKCSRGFRSWLSEGQFRIVQYKSNVLFLSGDFQ